MNERTFLKKFAESEQRDDAVNRLLVEMEYFAITEEITLDDVSTESMEELAEGVIKRGLSEYDE